MEKLNGVRVSVSAPALYEALAEECSELAQVALKRARILRKENPTPADEIETFKNFKEETCDVILMLNVLGASYDDELMVAKLDRWLKRLEEMFAARQPIQQPSEPEEPPMEIGEVETDIQVPDIEG